MCPFIAVSTAAIFKHVSLKRLVGVRLDSAAFLTLEAGSKYYHRWDARMGVWMGIYHDVDDADSLRSQWYGGQGTSQYSLSAEGQTAF